MGHRIKSKDFTKIGKKRIKKDLNRIKSIGKRGKKTYKLKDNPTRRIVYFYYNKLSQNNEKCLKRILKVVILVKLRIKGRRNISLEIPTTNVIYRT